MRILFALLLALPVLAGCLDGDTPAADLVLRDGALWSAGEEAGFATDLAVRDGRIVYVGDDAAPHIGAGTRVVDLDGAMVMPGFRDHHMHPIRARPLQPDFERIPQEQQLLADLQNHAAQVAGHGVRHVHYQAGDFDGDTEEEYEFCRPPDPDRIAEVRADYEAFEAEVASQGVTTLVNAGMRDLTEMAALKQMEEDGTSLVRWLVRVRAGCYEHLDDMGIKPHHGEWVQWHGVKLYGDGYLGAWVAALQAPYSDRPAWNGILVHTEAAIDHFIAQAKARGLHVGTHAIGDATILQVLDAYERAGMEPDDRWTVEHAQVTTPEIIDRFAELGAIPSIQLSFATTDERMANDRLGARLDDAYNWRGLVEAGVVVAGGTDYPIEVITPLWGLQRESTRQELDGVPAGGFLPDNGLSLAQALESITWGSAYAAREDDRGRLTDGNVADLVVLREDIFAIDPHDIAGTTVLMTVVNGKVVFEGEQNYPPPV